MIKYNSDYYYNLLRIHSGTAKQICDVRWKFIFDHITFDPNKQKKVLDYGCGVGFMKALAPDWASVDTYDIMPVPQTGIMSDEYDIVMLNDVLEHIPDFTELIPVLKKTEYVLVIVPIKPGSLLWSEYRHFKPGEHLHYFTHDLLEHIFKTMNFDLVVKGQPECPPREHVWTYLFKKGVIK